MQTTIAEHPLALSFRRAHQINEKVQACLEQPTTGDWLQAPAFFAEPHFGFRLRRLRQRYATKSNAVLAGVMLGGYQWSMLAASISCFLYDQRIPDLNPDHLWLKWDDERSYVSAVAFGSSRFAALRQDPAARHPDATLFDDVDQLREHLRFQIEDHMATAIERLSKRIRVNPRSMWPFVADRCASMILWLGQSQAKQGTCCCHLQQEVEALVRVPGSPLNNGVSGCQPVNYQNRTRLFLKRAACCYAYRLEEHDYCRTCPRLPQEERIDRLQELMQ